MIAFCTISFLTEFNLLFPNANPSFHSALRAAVHLYLCLSLSVLGNLSNVQFHTAAALKTDSTVNDSSSQNSTSVSFTQWLSFSGLSCK